MRKIYLDNIRWITVVLVVIYHVIYIFMKKWGNFTNAFSKWMCRKSWGLYVFHYLMIAVSGWYLHTLCPFLAPVIVYLLVAIAAFAGSYLLYEIMSRIPFIRWCVLGIKKEG